MAVAGLVGLISLAGAGVQMYGQMQQADAAKDAEKLRRRQMNLEAQRAKREQIRRAQVARASATANAVSQGAQFSSALAGGQAQINNESGRNQVAIEEDRGIGNNIFKANMRYAEAGKTIALGGGISALGGALSNMSGTITRLSY